MSQSLTSLPDDRRGAFSWVESAPSRRVIAAIAAARPDGAPGDAARFVGGCVRDAIVGRPVGDIDIATTLTPEETVAALEAAGVKAVPTGAEHGTITAVADHHGFEITSLRADVATDGRRATVRFSTDWDEDWRRRDLTMNAIYLTPDYRLYDPAGGAADAQAGRVRFIGEPTSRIREDYLRILRFYRFAAHYGRGALDVAGDAACAAERAGLKGLSAERIRVELLKLLSAPQPADALDVMAANGVLNEIMTSPHDLAATRRLAEIESGLGVAPDPVLRLAALNEGEPGALARRLRLSNAESAVLKSLANAPAIAADTDDQARRRLIYARGADDYRRAVRLSWARGADPVDAPGWAAAHAYTDQWRAPVLPVKGADALAAGLAPGPAVGETMKTLEAWWVEADFPDEAATRAKLEELCRDAAGRLA